jgi:hypothetical protein
MGRQRLHQRVSVGKIEAIELKGPSETRRLEAEAMGTPRLDIGSSSPDDIECTKLKLNNEAEIIGGEPGMAHETFEYSGCKVEGHKACKVNAGTEEGSIKSTPLTSKEVFHTQVAAEKKGGRRDGPAGQTKIRQPFVQSGDQRRKLP